MGDSRAAAVQHESDAVSVRLAETIVVAAPVGVAETIVVTAPVAIDNATVVEQLRQHE
jgi:hypothetical protein